MDASEQELANMSPEELKEYQKQNCIFCQISQGRVSSKKVYEDDKVCAILDINPANPGHILLLPREHFQIMPQMPDELIGHIFMVAKALCQASMNALQVRGTTVFAANGTAAGQKAPHFMVHVIPRALDDRLPFELKEHAVTDEELEALYPAIRLNIDKAFGLPVSEQKRIKKKEGGKPDLDVLTDFLTKK